MSPTPPNPDPTLPALASPSDNLPVSQSQIETPRTQITPRPLTPIQEKALQLLTSGIKPAQVARRLYVDRKTISNWLKTNVHFIAALNAWKHQTRQFGQARTLAMADRTLDTLEAALKAGNVKVALFLADRLGLFPPPHSGPQTPADVARSRARQSLKKHIKLAQDARDLKHAAFPHLAFASTDTVYSIDDRIWLLMLERKKALALESPQTRREREETQAEEAEGDEERQRINRAIRYATESAPDLIDPTPVQSIPA